MLLSITTTHVPAVDLSFLLHKHPDRVQDFNLMFGKAHIFYPEASDSRCTAVLLLEIDPIGFVKVRGPAGFPLVQYVSDRPYVASSFMRTAIAKVYGTALNAAVRSVQNWFKHQYRLRRESLRCHLGVVKGCSAGSLSH